MVFLFLCQKIWIPIFRSYTAYLYMHMHTVVTRRHYDVVLIGQTCKGPVEQGMQLGSVPPLSHPLPSSNDCMHMHTTFANMAQPTYVGRLFFVG